jgi:hypothetical protein
VITGKVQKFIAPEQLVQEGAPGGDQSNGLARRVPTRASGGVPPGGYLPLIILNIANGQEIAQA